MQGAEEEGLPPSNGFSVANPNQQLTLEPMRQMIFAESFHELEGMFC